MCEAHRKGARAPSLHSRRSISLKIGAWLRPVPEGHGWYQLMIGGGLGIRSLVMLRIQAKIGTCEPESNKCMQAVAFTTARDGALLEHAAFVYARGTAIAVIKVRTAMQARLL